MKKRTTTFTTVWHALRCLVPAKVYSLQSCFSEYKTFYDALVRHHGKVVAVKVLKEIFIQAKRVALGLSPRSEGRSHKIFVPYSIWLKTYHNGIPRKLRCSNRLLRSRHVFLRLIGLSIFNTYLVIKLSASRSVVEVTSPFRGCNYFGSLSFRVFCSWFVPKFRRFRYGKTSHIFSGFRSGPYGGPAFKYSLRDAYTLNDVPEYAFTKEALLNFLKLFYADDPDQFKFFKLALEEASEGFQKYFMPLKVHGVESFFEGRNKTFIEKYFPYFQKRSTRTLSALWDDGVKPLDQFDIGGYRRLLPALARLSFIPEKGGKTRVITMCNYWIQLGLFHFHHNMMSLIRSIPTDYAFDQGRSSEVLLKWTAEGRRLYSFDLSAATDRFPLMLQAFILDCLIHDLGKRWGSIITVPTKIQKRDHWFTVGQPMGVYSSWPVFSYCHHVVVRFCAYKVGFNPFRFNRYLILGDDLVIADRKVANIYYSFITKNLGVNISLTKSLVSFKGHSVAEFAKKLFVNGREISPLTPSLLSACRTDDVSAFRQIIDRLLVSWRLNVPSKSVFVKELSKRIIQRGRRNAVMCWLTSPKVFPEYLQGPEEKELQLLQNNIWRLDFYLGDTAHIDQAYREKVMRRVNKLGFDINFIFVRLMKRLYLRPLVSEVDHFARTSFVLDASRFHPLYSLLLILESEISESSEMSEKDYVRILILKKWVLALLNYNIVPRGSLYKLQRGMSVIGSKSDAEAARRIQDGRFAAMQIVTEHCEP